MWVPYSIKIDVKIASATLLQVPLGNILYDIECIVLYDRMVDFVVSGYVI